jgi:hypothetical protein
VSAKSPRQTPLAQGGGRTEQRTTELLSPGLVLHREVINKLLENLDRAFHRSVLPLCFTLDVRSQLLHLLEQQPDGRDCRRIEIVHLRNVHRCADAAGLRVDGKRGLEQVIKMARDRNIEPRVQVSEHDVFNRVRRAAQHAGDTALACLNLALDLLDLVLKRAPLRLACNRATLSEPQIMTRYAHRIEGWLASAPLSQLEKRSRTRFCTSGS